MKNQLKIEIFRKKEKLSHFGELWPSLLCSLQSFFKLLCLRIKHFSCQKLKVVDKQMAKLDRSWWEQNYYLIMYGDYLTGFCRIFRVHVLSGLCASVKVTKVISFHALGLIVGFAGCPLNFNLNFNASSSRYEPIWLEHTVQKRGLSNQ